MKDVNTMIKDGELFATANGSDGKTNARVRNVLALAQAMGADLRWVKGAHDHKGDLEVYWKSCVFEKTDTYGVNQIRHVGYQLTWEAKHSIKAIEGAWASGIACECEDNVKHVFESIP
jgi:hypothetical protein